MTDDRNPAYLFQGTHISLVLAIARGELDAVALARREMATRGLDRTGAWVGFDRAAQAWGLTGHESDAREPGYEVSKGGE